MCKHFYRFKKRSKSNKVLIFQCQHCDVTSAIKAYGWKTMLTSRRKRAAKLRKIYRSG